MLEIDIKLNRYGSDRDVTVIGNIFIANVGGDNGVYNYVYMIYEPASRFSSKVCLHGLIEGHDQVNSTSVLLRKIMQDYGDSSCELSEEYCKYWLEEKL